MELKWIKENLDGGRVDWDLLDVTNHMHLVGYFRECRPGNYFWIGNSNDWLGARIDQPTLQKAKKVAEALVLLEG